MHIDERIERLAERHESLAQVTELMIREWKVSADIERLTRIAEMRERRLDMIPGM